MVQSQIPGSEGNKDLFFLAEKDVTIIEILIFYFRL